jgi:predicted nucleic acid-binding protein
MRLVVADTGPLNYLVLIEAVELLPKLFERVFAPEAVRLELLDQDAPAGPTDLGGAAAGFA